MTFRRQVLSFSLSLAISLGGSPVAHAEATAREGLLKRCWTYLLTPAAESPVHQDLKTIREIRKLPSEERRAAFLAYGQPPAKNWLEKTPAVVDYVVTAFISAQIALGFKADPSALLPALLLVPPTLYLADFLGQAFHKWLDSYASETHPIWGSSAREFRKHHEVPSNLNEADYLSHISYFGILMAPFFFALPVLGHEPAIQAPTLLFLLTMMNSTEFHRQAHLPNPNIFIRKLQDMRLLIRNHMKHHKPPFDTEFSVFNGWSEGLTRKIQLWERLDNVWWKTFNKLPRNWIQDPRAIPPEVIADLENDLDLIPQELWDYADTFPRRVPEDVKKLVDQSRQAYVEKRRAYFNELAQTDPELAQQAWSEEQLAAPWVYGENPTLTLDRNKPH